MLPLSKSAKACPYLLNIYRKVLLKNEKKKKKKERKEEKHFWRNFGKYTICDLRQASSSGKFINVVARLSAQKRSTYNFLCALPTGESAKM